MTAYCFPLAANAGTLGFRVLKLSGIKHSLMKKIGGSVFASEREVNEAVAEAIARDDRRDRMKGLCSNCGHSEEKHCKAGTQHVPYKEEMKQAGPFLVTHPYSCVSDHCEVSLCDCLQFRRAS